MYIVSVDFFPCTLPHLEKIASIILTIIVIIIVILILFIIMQRQLLLPLKSTDLLHTMVLLNPMHRP